MRRAGAPAECRAENLSAAFEPGQPGRGTIMRWREFSSQRSGARVARASRQPGSGASRWRVHAVGGKPCSAVVF